MKSCDNAGAATQAMILRAAGTGVLLVLRSILLRQRAHFNKLGAVQLHLDVHGVSSWIRSEAYKAAAIVAPTVPHDEKNKREQHVGQKFEDVVEAVQYATSDFGALCFLLIPPHVCACSAV